MASVFPWRKRSEEFRQNIKIAREEAREKRFPSVDGVQNLQKQVCPKESMWALLPWDKKETYASAAKSRHCMESIQK